jgi:transcriptional regulator
MTLLWHEEVRALRTQGWKQAALAARFGCSPGMVSKICNPRPPAKPVNEEDEVLTLWKQGWDTLEISQLLKCSESDVYNRLAKVRG